jgi:hypothetical protein
MIKSTSLSKGKNRQFTHKNLYVGTNFQRIKGITMKLTVKRRFKRGELVTAVYRKIPFLKREKSPFTTIKKGRFLWSNSEDRRLKVSEIDPNTKVSTQYSVFDTKTYRPGTYFVEYLSDSDTSIHEKVSFTIYEPSKEEFELSSLYREKILEALKPSPLPVSVLKSQVIGAQ